MSLRSPMGRVLGLGAAKEGASHWWSQRVTAVALLVLTLWFVASLLRFPGLDHAQVAGWIGEPLNGMLLSLLIVTAAYHSQLGVQVVVEDYVASAPLKMAAILLLNFIHIALGVLGLFAVLRLAFGAPA